LPYCRSRVCYASQRLPRYQAPSRFPATPHLPKTLPFRQRRRCGQHARTPHCSTLRAPPHRAKNWDLDGTAPPPAPPAYPWDNSLDAAHRSALFRGIRAFLPTHTRPPNAHALLPAHTTSPAAALACAVSHAANAAPLMPTPAFAVITPSFSVLFIATPLPPNSGNGNRRGANAQTPALLPAVAASQHGVPSTRRHETRTTTPLRHSTRHFGGTLTSALPFTTYRLSTCCGWRMVSTSICDTRHRDLRHALPTAWPSRLRSLRTDAAYTTVNVVRCHHHRARSFCPHHRLSSDASTRGWRLSLPAPYTVLRKNVLGTLPRLRVARHYPARRHAGNKSTT